MAQPSPEIRARLAQLKAEAKIRAERDAQRQAAIRNAERISGQPVVLPTDKKAKGGSMSAEEAFGFEQKEPTVTERIQQKVMPVVDRAIDTALPFRKMGRIGVEALEKNVRRTTSQPGYQGGFSEGNADAAIRHLRNAARRAVGLETFDVPFDANRALGEITEGSFPRERSIDFYPGFSHGGQPSQDVMRFAIGGQGPRNFLKGTVEKIVDPLKDTSENIDPPELYERALQNPNLGQAAKQQIQQEYKRSLHHHHLNQWIERNLANYIRKQMGSPNDPVRKLAEQGILHMSPDLLEEQGIHGDDRRKMLGGEKLGKSEHAQAWEDAVDSTFEPNSVEDIINSPDLYRGLQEPWMEKADPKTNVYELYGARELGFDHLVDVLKDDLASGRLSPEQLSNVSIERAVRRAYEVDLANKKAMQEASAKATEGMPVHKDYGNGFKWIEIAPKKPDLNDPLPKGYEWLEPKAGLERLSGKSILAPDRGRVHLGETKQEALETAYKKDHKLSDRLEKPVKDALAYESDIMGHCVGGQRQPDGTRTGGYTDDVMAGRTRIFSLRDENNEPHVTIEVRPKTDNTSPGAWLNTLSPEQQLQIDESGIKPGDMPEYHRWVKSQPPAIKQIKGKQNAKPKAKYIPFVQDFVRQGQWSSVGDFKNTDLVRKSDLIDKFSPEELDAVGQGEYLTQQEHSDLLLNKLKPGMAKGGRVSKEPKSTVKAYKLFRADEKQPGKLFPLFVNANKPVEMNKWVDAEVGAQNDKGKVKSKIGPLAYRPGWHAGDLPVATHIGEKTDNSLKKPDYRPRHHVWAEVEMPNDVDWQAEANKRGTNKKGKVVSVNAHITDQIPKGGHYRYKTNPNMTGNWLIGGSMKVNRVLSHNEVERINKKAGVSDLPRIEPFNKKDFGFKQGGSVGDAESYFFPENKE